MNEDVGHSNTFLTDEKRKPIEASPLTNRAAFKAPPNLAIYKDDQPHPVLAHVLNLANQAKSAYEPQFGALQEKWTKADEMYWIQQRESRMSEMTRAQVSGTTFYRCVRRLADGAYLATFAANDELPIRWVPDISPFDDSQKKQERALVTEAANRGSEYSYRRAQVKGEARKAYHQVYKYANVIVYTPWDYVIEEKTRYENYDPNDAVPNAAGAPKFIHRDSGEVSDTPHALEIRKITDEKVTKNHLGFYVQPVQACMLDNRIEDLDRQTCFLWRSDMTRPEIQDEARSGRFINTDKITELQKFQQYSWENQPEVSRITDAGKTTADSWESEVYERWQAWILLPEIEYKQNAKGEVSSMKWDQNAKECRYLLEMVGPMGPQAICVRLCKSPYPDNGIPFIAAHSHEDDSGFWHRGGEELLEDNMIQERTAKGQMMDCRTLRVLRPMIRQVGRVRNRDMRISQNTVFDVTAKDALSFVDIPDITQTIEASLVYVKNESEEVMQVPKFFLGEATGGRTSATEFSSIRDQGAAPALNDINTLNDQIIGGYLRKWKKYAPHFLDEEIIVPIAATPADPNPKDTIARVLPDELHADMVLKAVATKEFENKTASRQGFIQLVTGILANPIFNGVVNPVAALVKAFSMFPEVVPNPEELLIKNPVVQMALLEYQTQKQQQPQPGQGGSTPEPLPPMPVGGAAPQIGGPGRATGNALAATNGASRGA